MREIQTRCLRCGRPLKAPGSVTARMGATCQRKAGEALATYTDAQVAKVAELLEDGGIAPARKGSPVYLAVSSDGTRLYLVGPKGCTCTHGRLSAQRGTPAHCFHTAARRVLAA